MLVKLHRFIQQYQTQAAAAKALEVTPQYLSDVKYGHRKPSDKILSALGLKKVVHYEHAKENR